MTCGENKAAKLVLTLLAAAAAAVAAVVVVATHAHSGMDGNCNVWI